MRTTRSEKTGGDRPGERTRKALATLGCSLLILGSAAGCAEMGEVKNAILEKERDKEIRPGYQRPVSTQRSYKTGERPFR